jgi:hypothetical protein
MYVGSLQGRDGSHDGFVREDSRWQPMHSMAHAGMRRGVTTSWTKSLTSSTHSSRRRPTRCEQRNEVGCTSFVAATYDRRCERSEPPIPVYRSNCSTVGPALTRPPIAM